ncbi:hypothetical protein ABIB00_007613 [Bradyrhizobium sp. LB14.3]
MAGEGLLAGRSTRRPRPDGARVFAPPTIQSPRARITSAGAVARSHGSGTSWPSRMTPMVLTKPASRLRRWRRSGPSTQHAVEVLGPSLRIGLRIVRTSILIAAPQSRMNLAYRAVSNTLGHQARRPSRCAHRTRRAASSNWRSASSNTASSGLAGADVTSTMALPNGVRNSTNSGSARNDDKSSARSR